MRQKSVNINTVYVLKTKQSAEPASAVFVSKKLHEHGNICLFELTNYSSILITGKFLYVIFGLRQSNKHISFHRLSCLSKVNKPRNGNETYCSDSLKTVSINI